MIPTYDFQFNDFLQVDKCSEGQIDRQTDRQADSQTDREVDRQTDRQTDGWTCLDRLFCHPNADTSICLLYRTV